jgi:hypothetical protein
MSETDAQRRRRWINLGELIAIAALIVSALGVWIAWQSSKTDKPTRVVEQRQPIPLVLRARVEDDGRRLVIEPVEPGHALESLNLSVRRAYPIELGSEGVLKADYVETKLSGADLNKGVHSAPVGVSGRYVEMGKERSYSGNYLLHYRVEGGGLLGGRSLRLMGLSRA